MYEREERRAGEFDVAYEDGSLDIVDVWQMSIRRAAFGYGVSWEPTSRRFTLRSTGEPVKQNTSGEYKIFRFGSELILTSDEPNAK